MEQKTKVFAEDGKQDLMITREFDLPLELLFKAYIEPEIVEQWMGTKVIKLQNNKHGCYQFETTDPKGNTHVFSGVIHELILNEKITKTFEMEHKPYGVQLEIYNFQKVADNRSQLKMHVIYESVAHRDGVLQLPFSQGINMAHSRLEKLFSQLKRSKI